MCYWYHLYDGHLYCRWIIFFFYYRKYIILFSICANKTDGLLAFYKVYCMYKIYHKILDKLNSKQLLMMCVSNTPLWISSMDEDFSKTHCTPSLQQINTIHQQLYDLYHCMTCITYQVLMNWLQFSIVLFSRSYLFTYVVKCS